MIRIENFLAVVAGDEWAATRAARELKTTWSETQSLPGSDSLDVIMHAAPSERDQVGINHGDATATLSASARQLSATYYWPFQSHASLGPSCAIADVKDSGTTVWSSTQDSFGLRSLLARTFGVPQDKVRVVYMDGSGSYGSNGAYDAAADAFILSHAVGGPVRLQWTRHDEHVWDPKGPAQLLELRGGLDAEGNIVAWESHASGPVGPQWTSGLLGPTAAGITRETGRAGGTPVTQNIDPPYPVPNLRVVAHQLRDLPIRLSNLRAPGKIANVFAVESFTDELAAAAAMDPVAFRRRGLSDPRAIAVLDRAASMMDWQPRPSPNPRPIQGNLLIINPDGLRNQVEGNIVQTLSRALYEEVTFDQSHVTSVDWATYRIMRFPDAPAIDVALIDHPDEPAYGAGEAACAPVAAALANAIFDASGARLRRVPFTPARVKAAMSAPRPVAGSRG